MRASAVHITPAGGYGSGGGADDGERQKDVTLLQWMSDQIVGKEGHFKISCACAFATIIIFDLNSLAPLSLSFSSAVADHVSVRA